jgi:hypothetical protein
LCEELEIKGASFLLKNHQLKNVSKKFAFRRFGHFVGIGVGVDGIVNVGVGVIVVVVSGSRI